MDTGTVVVKDRRQPSHGLHRCGDNTNLAARLQSLAQPGLIYTSPSIYAPGTPIFDFRPIASTRSRISESVASMSCSDLVLEEDESPPSDLGAWFTAGGARCQIALVQAELDG